MRYVMSELVDGSVNLDIMLLVLYVYLYGETTFLFARDSEDSNVKAPPKSRMTWCKTQHDACSGSPFESFAPETLLTNDQRQKDDSLIHLTNEDVIPAIRIPAHQVVSLRPERHMASVSRDRGIE